MGWSKVARSRLFLKLKGPSKARTVAAQPGYCLSAGSPSWCVGQQPGPQNTSSYWVTSFSFSDSWARCVYYSMTKGAGLCRTTPLSRLETCSPFSWVPPNSHGFCSSWQVPVHLCFPHFTFIFPLTCQTQKE